VTKYKFILQKKSNKARTGIIKTSLGDIKTPAFMPVATQGAIKSTPINIIEDMGYEMILSNRNLPTVVNRGEGFHRDKVNFLPDVLKEYDVSADEVAYLGDDLFDYRIMQEVGYPYCVDDSPRSLQQISYPLHCKGGENAVMYFFEDLEDRELIPVVPSDVVMGKIYELDLKEKF